MWPNLLDRPRLAMPLIAAYETVVFAVGFFRGVFGGLRDRWQERLMTLADDALRHRLTRYRSRYLGDVRFATRGIEQLGILRKAAWAPSLDKVFIDVALVGRPAHETLRDGLVGLRGIEGGRRSLRSFLDGDQ